MDADKLRAYIERSTEKSGVPVKVRDQSALLSIASLVKPIRERVRGLIDSK